MTEFDDLKALVTDLGRRLDALENAKRPSPHVDLSSVEGVERFERLLELLQGSIRDLAADNHDLHEKIGFLVEILEETNPQQGGTTRALHTGAASGQTSLALRLLAVEARLAEMGRSPGAGGDPSVRAFLRRFARAGLGVARRAGRPAWRGARRIARRLTAGASSGDAGGTGVVLAARPRLVCPALAVIIPVDGLSRQDMDAIDLGLARQTTHNWQSVTWSRARGRYEVRSALGLLLAEGAAGNEDDLRDALIAPYACTFTADCSRLSNAALEIGLWTAAGEGLRAVLLVPGEGAAGGGRDPGADARSEPRASCELAIVERELWGAAGLDADRIRELAGRVSATPIAKVVAPSGLPSGQPQHGEDRWRSWGLRPVDGYPGYLAGPGFRAPRWRREVFPLDQVIDEPVVPDARPSVLVLVPSPEGDDAEVELHDLTAKLAAQFRFVVVALAEHGEASNTTVAGIWGDAGLWFDLAALPRELHGSCLALLVRRYQVETLLALDGTLWLGGSMAWFRARFPRLRFVSWLSREPELMTHWRLQDLVTGLDRWLVSGEHLARRVLRLPELQTARLRYLRRGVAFDPNRRSASGGERALRLRAALGVPESAVVVAMSATRAAENRHEDFVGLANLSRETAGVHFLLAGDVGSNGGVERLAASFRLTNFTHVPAGFPQDDLLAVTDVACSTGEEGASLTFLLKALAAGTPIVATAAAAEEIIARDGGCGAFVAGTGDLQGFHDALLGLRDRSVREQLGSRGRRVAEEFFGLDQPARTLAEALALDGGGTA